jgi:hypothetical protein
MVERASRQDAQSFVGPNQFRGDSADGAVTARRDDDLFAALRGFARYGRDVFVIVGVDNARLLAQCSKQLDNPRLGIFRPTRATIHNHDHAVESFYLLLMLLIMIIILVCSGADREGSRS